MTDPSRTPRVEEAPRTEAGRELAQTWMASPNDSFFDGEYDINGAILAIEAEAGRLGESAPATDPFANWRAEAASCEWLAADPSQGPKQAARWRYRGEAIREVLETVDAALPSTPQEPTAELRAALRDAYTLLVSAEPTLIRDAKTGPNETSLHYKALLRDRVAEWLEPYRDDFDAGVAALHDPSLQAPPPPMSDRWQMELENLAEHGYQPTYNGRPSCPFCANFIDDEETHEPDCPLVAALRAASQPTGDPA